MSEGSESYPGCCDKRPRIATIGLEVDWNTSLQRIATKTQNQYTEDRKLCMYGGDQLILESSGLPTLDFCNSLNPAGTAHVKEFCAKFTISKCWQSPNSTRRVPVTQHYVHGWNLPCMQLAIWWKLDIRKKLDDQQKLFIDKFGIFHHPLIQFHIHTDIFDHIWNWGWTRLQEWIIITSICGENSSICMRGLLV